MRTISQKSIVTQAYIWLIAPVVLFVAFWIRPLVSVPVLAGIAWSIWRIYNPRIDGKRLRRDGFMDSEGFSSVTVDRKWWWIMGLAAFYVLQSGIGSLYYQIPADHDWRNAVFYDLSRRSWPVTYGEGADLGILCYYIGFWLPSALVSKATGLIVPGDIAQLIYASWGVWIALNFIISWCGGKAKWFILLIFVLFDYWELPIKFLLNPEEFAYVHGIWDKALFWIEYSGYQGLPPNRIMFSFTYNQGVPSWVGFMLLWHQRHNIKALLFNYALLLLFAPFPWICIFPYVTVKLLQHFRKAITVENVTGLFVGLCVGIYFLSNRSGGSIGWADSDEPLYVVPIYGVAFTLMAYGVYLPFIWNKVKHNMLFWSMLVTAFFVPFVQFRENLDVGLRVAMPLTVFISVALCRMLSEMPRGKNPVRRLFWCVFAIGAIMPAWQIVFAARGELNALLHHQPVKLIYYMGYLDDPTRNLDADNFVGRGESLYTRWLMPR